MKFSSFILVLALAIFSSCSNAPSRPGAILDENYEPVDPAPAAATAAPTTAEPAQNAQGVWHYTCPSGCAGGGGSATPCAACGTTLVHNTAYHSGAGASNTAATTPAGTPVGSITNPVVNGVGTPAVTNVSPPATKTPEPAQNADGVWHYTCSAGCAGGAGSAVACAGCGATLVHNTAYH